MAKLWHLVEFICKYMPEVRKKVLKTLLKNMNQMVESDISQTHYQLFPRLTNIFILLSVHYQTTDHNQSQEESFKSTPKCPSTGSEIKRGWSTIAKHRISTYQVPGFLPYSSGAIHIANQCV